MHAGMTICMATQHPDCSQVSRRAWSAPPWPSDSSWSCCQDHQKNRQPPNRSGGRQIPGYVLRQHGKRSHFSQNKKGCCHPPSLHCHLFKLGGLLVVLRQGKLVLVLRFNDVLGENFEGVRQKDVRLVYHSGALNLTHGLDQRPNGNKHVQHQSLLNSPSWETANTPNLCPGLRSLLRWKILRVLLLDVVQYLLEHLILCAQHQGLPWHWFFR